MLEVGWWWCLLLRVGRALLRMFTRARRLLTVRRRLADCLLLARVQTQLVLVWVLAWVWVQALVQAQAQVVAEVLVLLVGGGRHCLLGLEQQLGVVQVLLLLEAQKLVLLLFHELVAQLLVAVVADVVVVEIKIITIIIVIVTIGGAA